MYLTYGCGNGLLFHMTQPTSRSIIKAIICSKPTIVDILVLQCFVHSYCVIPSNIPFVIQHDVLVCKQSDRRHDSLQTYITAVGHCFLWRIRTPNALVCQFILKFDYIPNSALRVSDFTPKCIGVFVVYLNIIERSSQLRVLLESY